MDLLLFCKNQELASRCVSVLNRSGFRLRIFDNPVQARACLFASQIDIVLIASRNCRNESSGLQTFIRDQNLRIPVFCLESCESTNPLSFTLEPVNDFAFKLKQLLSGFDENSMNYGKAEPTKRTPKRSYHPADFKSAKAIFEREFLVDALHKYRGNISQTAHAIGIARRNLQLRLRKFNINADKLR